ncbi:MAG: CpXC domain-containing protein [Elusimicrobiaceae bacterium]
MKSIKGEGGATCPNGCEPFDAEYWTLVRGDQDAELKEALLGGELNLISCPSCGEFFYHDRDVVYFDPPKELLAFVSPKADKDNFDEIKKKMQKDFEFLRKNLAEMNINYSPFYLAGMEELKSLLEYDDYSSCQSEVIAASAAQKGFKVTPLAPSAARVNGYPLYLPVDGDKYEARSVLKAAEALLAANPALTLLSALIKDLKAGKDLPAHL